MTGFGALLTRRGADLEALARAADLAESDLVAVRDGAEPSGSLLRKIAPALGWHASDLFLVAGLPVPRDLAPAERPALTSVTPLIWSLTHLPAVAPVNGRWTGPGFGALLLRLFGNRNLTASDAVRILYLLAGGRSRPSTPSA